MRLVFIADSKLTTLYHMAAAHLGLARETRLMENEKLSNYLPDIPRMGYPITDLT